MYDKSRPKSAKLARAHGLPKIHKLFENIPSFRSLIVNRHNRYNALSFRPITDTTGTTHYLFVL